MKRIRYNITILILSLLFSNYVIAEKNKTNSNSSNNNKSTHSISAGCTQATTSTNLELNNVRAMIHTGGDMWWDLQGTAEYEVPKGSGKTAFFAGSIWIGGKDINGQLKLAAIQFRSSGTDYWTGPLIVDGPERSNVTADICHEYDRHYSISRNEVAMFRNYINASLSGDQATLEKDFVGYQVPTIIEEWPAHGPAGGYDYYLAPFFDKNDDGTYNHLDGDYPFYDLDGALPCGTTREKRLPRLFGDETLWWVYNDKGNIHTETGGDAVGMEIRAQGFAFATNDELNNMTFYNYALLNRSTFVLYDSYFGVWSDADMGYAFDDYVGCDVQRGLGYLYNGEATDGTGQLFAYGGPTPPPPAIGVDFFEGPYMDDNYGDDRPDGGCDMSINGLNFGDGVAGNERWGMRRYIYYNNDQGNMGNPGSAVEHYNYLTGFWKDGNSLLYGGTGHPSDSDTEDQITDFMFPGDTDPCGWGQDGIPMTSYPRYPWTEEGEDNPPDDRRFIQSAGPFTLEPGAINDITVGVVWARATSGGPFESVEEVKKADDKAQLLFENCFKVVDGPDAPELTIIELDKELIFHISNLSTSNNYLEEYYERDPFIVCPDGDDDCNRYFDFQGYQVFQLYDADVSITDIHNPDLAREVFQCDIKDEISKIVNYEWDEELAANIPILEVDGADEGIQHTFTIVNDEFSLSSGSLVNNKRYYFIVIAYGFNDYLHYDQNDPLSISGQKKPYKAGRKGALGAIKTYEVIPHIPTPENNGTIVNGEYGYGPKITQISGHGNGNNSLELTEETIDEIMSGSPWKSNNPTYENGLGPIDVKVIDPLNIPDGNYTLEFDSISIFQTTSFRYSIIKNAKWFIYDESGDTIYSDSWIALENEQIFPEWGFSISIKQVGVINEDNQNLTALDQPDNSAFIEASMTMEDNTKTWLNFVFDGEGYDAFNWIRSGTQNDDTQPEFNDYLGDDEDEVYEKVLNGTWAPYAFTSEYFNGPAWKEMRSLVEFKAQRLPSVDIVFTSDKSKWTRAVVLEMADNDSLDGNPTDLILQMGVVGETYKFDKRDSYSVDKDGNPSETESGSNSQNDANFIDGKGMGWFPGYAIDVGTGERLNIMYGEDSRLLTQNGRDMIWNPTSSYGTDLFFVTGGASGELFFGGKHYIYIMGHNNYSEENKNYMPTYDDGKYIDSMLTPVVGESSYQYKKRKKTVMRNAAWVGLPMLRRDANLLDTDVSIKLRVANPYRNDELSFAKVENPDGSGINTPKYSFNTSDIKTVTDDNATAKDALDLINVVPNPYYGFSEYEKNQIETMVKFTNLPPKCTISIYTISGTLVRRFEKDNADTFIEWDIKNQYGIAVASGIYIIHVDAEGIGEKILKWFGALRPTDLNAF
ncbi:MAG: T9SS type A sorting domain-containing protein [Bacteroidetes bacterium]|jgi:hypothetical protein|nr:T9SS type A sorting domain-containing protein [Bacteroidota bacterium]MBT6684750.1 T9SS type A sorting domain-containing protein [Bacteroidota bacterium]MBT7143851.1 T9SS type A sorting domain-containing protein [Bacteroidota bacterium]MBT7489968.1 T9SS type A sorting domain-containing protein [Bacteroidota bacterium]